MQGVQLTNDENTRYEYIWQTAHAAEDARTAVGQNNCQYSEQNKDNERGSTGTSGPQVSYVERVQVASNCVIFLFFTHFIMQ